MNNILKVYLKNCIFLTLIIFIFSLLIFKHFQPSSDPDIWWHLNIGRDILQKGIQFKDIYSYTLAGYKWVDHEWLLNVFMYILYSLSNNNFLILSIIFAALSFFSLYNVLKTALPKNNIAFYFSLLLGIFACASCLGVRAQVISLFCTSILWNIVNKHKLKQYKYLVFLFLIWANLHGAVIIGLAVLGLDLLLSFKKKKVFKYKFFVFVLSFLATLINPYHFHIYLESFKVFLDSTSHQYIEEWKNPDLANIRFLPFLVYIISLYYFLLKFKIKPISLIILLLFSILSLRSTRHITLFILFSLPFYYSSLEKILQTVPIKPPQNLVLFFSFFGILSFGSFALETLINKPNQVVNQAAYYSEYPQKALDFIEKKNLKGNILAEYGWGGFISWYKPKLKVFIDGRMPSWAGILKDFVSIRLKGDLNTLQKYQIKYLLLKTNSKYYEFSNWQIIYKDNISLILAPPSEKIELCYIA